MIATLLTLFLTLQASIAQPFDIRAKDSLILGKGAQSGVTYYDVPSEYGVRDHRYTVVNGRTVLVDPRTRRVVEILD